MLLSCCPKNSQDAAVLTALKVVQDTEKKHPHKEVQRPVPSSSTCLHHAAMRDEILFSKCAQVIKSREFVPIPPHTSFLLSAHGAAHICYCCYMSLNLHEFFFLLQFSSGPNLILVNQSLCPSESTCILIVKAMSFHKKSVKSANFLFFYLVS
jgi:hypothetical protein